MEEIRGLRISTNPEAWILREPAMKIFYGSSAGREDVSCNSPIEASLETALDIFRAFDPRKGFIGIPLDERFVLQMSAQKDNKINVELLDTSIPAFDSCDTEVDFAEDLIRAAAEGQDVFRIARASHYEWKHLDMS